MPLWGQAYIPNLGELDDLDDLYDFPKNSGTPHVSRCVINSAIANVTPHWQSATCKSTTVDGRNPHHMGCIKPCK